MGIQHQKVSPTAYKLNGFYTTVPVISPFLAVVPKTNREESLQVSDVGFICHKTGPTAQEFCDCFIIHEVLKKNIRTISAVIRKSLGLPTSKFLNLQRYKATSTSKAGSSGLNRGPCLYQLHHNN